MLKAEKEGLDPATHNNVAFNMQVDREARGSADQTTSYMFSGIGGLAVVRTELLGQNSNVEGGATRRPRIWTFSFRP